MWALYLLLNQVRNHHIPTNMLKVDVPHLQPGEEGNVIVGFISPLEPGKKSLIPTNMLKVDVPHLQPGEEGNVSVGFKSPLEPGKKSSHSHKYVDSRCSSPPARRRRKCDRGLHISS